MMLNFCCCVWQMCAVRKKYGQAFLSGKAVKTCIGKGTKIAVAHVLVFAHVMCAFVCQNSHVHVLLYVRTCLYACMRSDICKGTNLQVGCICCPYLHIYAIGQKSMNARPS